jgi:hypothetical protein
MKNLLSPAILLSIVVACSSCAIICPNPGGPVSEKRIQRHDAKPFRAEVKQPVTFDKCYLSTLPKRTMRGWKHYFITMDGDTIIRYLSYRQDTGKYYPVYKTRDQL